MEITRSKLTYLTFVVRQTHVKRLQNPALSLYTGWLIVIPLLDCDYPQHIGSHNPPTNHPSTVNYRVYHPSRAYNQPSQGFLATIVMNPEIAHEVISHHVSAISTYLPQKIMVKTLPKCSMYGMFTYIYHQNGPDVARDSSTMEHMGYISTYYNHQPTGMATTALPFHTSMLSCFARAWAVKRICTLAC